MFEPAETLRQRVDVFRRSLQENLVVLDDQIESGLGRRKLLLLVLLLLELLRGRAVGVRERRTQGCRCCVDEALSPETELTREQRERVIRLRCADLKRVEGLDSVVVVSERGDAIDTLTEAL